ncbi:MAG: hypothetical protein HQ522_23740 [Bacteroidetes bacterium]|nr:hypothetical protein [Bacteroidota bacterium]
MITIAQRGTELELVSHTTYNEIKTGYSGWADSIGGPIKATNVANLQPQNVCICEIVLPSIKQQLQISESHF